MTARGTLLVALVAAALPGCGSDDDGGGSGLPTKFTDCGKNQCEVALSAFQKDPNVTPYCETKLEAAVIACDKGVLRTGTCGDFTVADYTYGMAGDFWRCVYDTASGALVGARWVPDNHPQQFAGAEPPEGCSPSQMPCGGPS